MTAQVKGHCEHPLLVHHDGSMSCERPGCADARGPVEVGRALARHVVRVACDDPGRARCDRCHPRLDQRTGGLKSFAHDRRTLTRARIRDAAMEVVARRGLGATVDEIAQVAGVHLRTVFRHYPTHDQLIASTINDMFEASGLPPSGTDVDRWFGSLPQRVDDVDEWIEKLAHTAHIGNAEVFGAVFWDIAALRQDKSDALAELDALRADYRRRGIAYIVGTAWRSSGGVGDPPESLTMTFALVLSAFSTQALMIDFDRTPAQAGALAAEILKTVLRDALRAQPSSD